MKEWQTKFSDYLATRKAALIEKLRTEKAISEALGAELKAATIEFKQTFR